MSVLTARSSTFVPFSRRTSHTWRNIPLPEYQRQFGWRSFLTVTLSVFAPTFSESADSGTVKPVYP